MHKILLMMLVSTMLSGCIYVHNSFEGATDKGCPPNVTITVTDNSSDDTKAIDKMSEVINKVPGL